MWCCFETRQGCGAAGSRVINIKGTTAGCSSLCMCWCPITVWQPQPIRSGLNFSGRISLEWLPSPAGATTITAGSQGVSLNMNWKRCDFSVVLDVTVGLLITVSPVQLQNYWCSSRRVLHDHDKNHDHNYFKLYKNFDHQTWLLTDLKQYAFIEPLKHSEAELEI